MNGGGFYRSVVGTGPGRSMTSESQPTSQQQIIVTAQDVSRQVYERRRARCDALGIKNLGTLEAHGLRKGYYALRSSLVPSQGEFPAIFCSLAGVLPDEEWEVVGIVQNPGDREKGELPAVLVAGLSWGFRSNGSSVFRDGEWIGLRAPSGGRPSPLAGTEGIPEGAVLPEIFPFSRLSVTHRMDEINKEVRAVLVNAVKDRNLMRGSADALVAAARAKAYHDLAWGCYDVAAAAAIAAAGGGGVPAAGAGVATTVVDRLANYNRGAAAAPLIGGPTANGIALQIRANSDIILANPGPVVGATAGERLAFNAYNYAAANMRGAITRAVAGLSDQEVALNNAAARLGIAVMAVTAGIPPSVAWLSVNGQGDRDALAGYTAINVAGRAAAIAAAKTAAAGAAGAANIPDAYGIGPGPAITIADAHLAYDNRANAYDAASAAYAAAIIAYDNSTPTDVTVMQTAILPTHERVAIAPGWTDNVNAEIQTSLSDAIPNIAKGADGIAGGRNGPMERYAWFVASRLGYINDNWYAPQNTEDVQTFRNTINNAVTAVWNSADASSHPFDSGGRRAVVTAVTAATQAKARVYDSPHSGVISDEITSRLACEQIEFMKKRIVGYCAAPSPANATTLDIIVG